jgi:hypothetical protein
VCSGQQIPRHSEIEALLRSVGPFVFPTSLRLARRSASREGARSGPPSAATPNLRSSLGPELRLASHAKVVRRS